MLSLPVGIGLAKHGKSSQLALRSLREATSQHDGIHLDKIVHKEVLYKTQLHSYTVAYNTCKSTVLRPELFLYEYYIFHLQY